MMIAEVYTLEEEGRTFDGVQRILSDFCKHIAHTFTTIDQLDEKYDVIIHYDTFRIIKQSDDGQFSTFRYGMITDLPEVDIDLSVQRVDLKMFDFDFLCSTVVEENELFIMTRGLFEWFNKLSHRAIIDEAIREVEENGDKNANGGTGSVHSKPSGGLRARCGNLLGQGREGKLRKLHKKDSEDGA